MDLPQDGNKKASEEWLPCTRRNAKKKWMPQEILDKMEVKRLLKNDPEKYHEVDQQIGTMCKYAKEQYLSACCVEIEELEKKEVQVMHEKVQEVTHRKVKSQTGCIRDADCSVLMDDEAVKRRWTEYIKDLYGDIGRKEKPEIKKTMKGREFSPVEIQKAMKKMKCGKAGGSDGTLL